MSVLSDKVYQRQMHSKHYHSAIDRHHHYMIDFLEWVAVFGVIAFVLSDLSRIQAITNFISSLLG